MFVTHVQSFGPFVKVYGQNDKNESQLVETSIDALIPLLSQTMAPQLAELHPQSVFLTMLHEHYYRTKLNGIGSNGMITVSFIDYGYERQVPLNDVSIFYTTGIL